MQFLTVQQAVIHPEIQPLEIVERKGLGHPDALADGIADAVSIAYSRECQRRFGIVLHHNLDKVYIGAGHFRPRFGSVEMVRPVQLRINGRMSNSFGAERMNIVQLQTTAARIYLSCVLPHLDSERELFVEANATQHTLRDHWFSPRSAEDVSDASHPVANDTAVCVAHAPLSTCEQLALALERSLWVGSGEHLAPKFPYVGQDVKVMVWRRGNEVEVTMCIPLLARQTMSQAFYQEKEQFLRETLREHTQQALVRSALRLTAFTLNPTARPYLLGTGSCIECGEEGVVGRGNRANGLISVIRPSSIEAPFGKNPVYHTGRVQTFLVHHLAQAIWAQTGTGCSVYALTKNGQSLVPPDQLLVLTATPIPQKAVEVIVEQEYLNIDYLSEILRLPFSLRE